MKETGLSRISKNIIISEVEKELKQREVFFIADHGSIAASALDKLRAKLRSTKTRYFVVKKSLGKKAFERAKMKDVADKLDGACGIAFSSGDVVASSKILVDFAKENEVFKIQQGFMNGQLVTADQIKSMASLPSKEVLLARVLGGMQAPMSRFVNVLSGTVRQVVTVLDAIAKKKQAG